MKCKCKNCGRPIDQEAGEPALVVNATDPAHCYVVCENCRDKLGLEIVACASCTELTEAVRLTHAAEPLGFTPCPSCGRDVYTGKAQGEYKTVQCKQCDRVIFDPEEDARTINEGTEYEYTVCEPCFDDMWDQNQIVKCAGCGRWYEDRALTRDPDVEDFVPCPHCGADVCEGYSREEAIELMNERKENAAMPQNHETLNYRESAEAMIFEMANIITENHRMKKENSDLRLRVATLEALVEGMRPGGNYDKYDFLVGIEAQNAAYDLHRSAGWCSNAERVNDWEQKLSEFEKARKEKK